MRQILDVPQRQREPDIHHHRQAIDLRAALEVLERVALCQGPTLRARPARLNMHEPLRRLGIAAKEHLAILNACGQRQPKKAIELLTDHIEVSRAHTLVVKPM